MFLTILFVYLAIGSIWGLFDPKRIIMSEVNKLRFENMARIANNQEIVPEKIILVFNLILRTSAILIWPLILGVIISKMVNMK